MITTIVFDIGGVFFHQAEKTTFQRNIGFVDQTLADDVMSSGALWDIYKRGGMTEEDYWNHLIEQLPVRNGESWSTLRSQFEHSVKLDTELVQLTRILKQKYKVYALSNAGAELERRLQHFGIADLFEGVINSHYVKMAKPDEQIYRYTSDLVGAEPEQILFVDDKSRNTRVADKLGWNTYIYTTAQAFDRFLVQSKIDFKGSHLV